MRSMDLGASGCSQSHFKTLRESSVTYKNILHYAATDSKNTRAWFAHTQIYIAIEYSSSKPMLLRLRFCAICVLCVFMYVCMRPK